MFQHTAARRRLGPKQSHRNQNQRRFNTQPPEGGWRCVSPARLLKTLVSTHSRPKAAGWGGGCRSVMWVVSTHSRPKAAGLGEVQKLASMNVSTHSRPKAAGEIAELGYYHPLVSTHSRPKAAGCHHQQIKYVGRFQHTAARRRLEPLSKALLHQVSQPRVR